MSSTIYRPIALRAAGGVEALSPLFSDLPPEIPIAFFMVLHVQPHGQSRLPLILERNGRLSEGKETRG